jgi:hypothetical protein
MKNVYIYAWFSEKRHLNLKNVDLHSSFSENMDLYQKKGGPLRMVF